MSSYRGKIDANHVAYTGQNIIHFGILCQEEKGSVGGEGGRNEKSKKEKLICVGILMAQRQEGPFRLELDWLRAINKRETNATQRYNPSHI
jgi:hypothetical protein